MEITKKQLIDALKDVNDDAPICIERYHDGIYGDDAEIMVLKSIDVVKPEDNEIDLGYVVLI